MAEFARCSNCNIPVRPSTGVCPMCGQVSAAQFADREEPHTRPRRKRREGGEPGSAKKKKARSAGKGLYRDGNKLVIREGASFPGRCPICNKECDAEETVDFTFARDKARYIEVAAVQAVARGVSDLVSGARYTGPVCAEIPLCPWHRARRLRRFGIGVGLAVLAVGVLIAQYAMEMEIVPSGELGFLNISCHNFIAIAVAFVGTVVALTCVFDSSKLWFKATKYRDRFVWVTGAGRAFLAELPQVKEHHFNRRADDPDLDADELIRRARLDDE